MPLDKATYGTAECESLCRRYASKEGCCLVGDSFGCYWRDGAVVSTDPRNDDDGLAVACKFGSKSKFFLML